ncbi:type II toxin-antitoxin system HicA family toxin [Sphingomonas phyllosphaerae]|uniref:type II toxin-antitoxin system HicA family toxin n=1 Tax=Sphingomonas phyllosphaerae TaxID=257003 RepID=UPI002413AF49|nr:type II toxin-antitoxin system HicA family toxin [Sphingomonas phyllosphaerae]
MRRAEVIRRFEADGWYVVRQTGSHRHVRHPVEPGTATVPHPKRELPIGTLKSIARQTGVDLA